VRRRRLKKNPCVVKQKLKRHDAQTPILLADHRSIRRLHNLAARLDTHKQRLIQFGPGQTRPIESFSTEIQDFISHLHPSVQNIHAIEHISKATYLLRGNLHRVRSKFLKYLYRIYLFSSMFLPGSCLQHSFL
jgi:hypothetical protein